MSIKDAATSGGMSIWKFRMAIIYCFLFTINSLGTVVVAGLVNSDWYAMNTQSKFLFYAMVTINWTGTMMAFLSRNAKKLEDGDLPDDSSTTTTVQTASQTTVQQQTLNKL